MHRHFPLLLTVCWLAAAAATAAAKDVLLLRGTTSIPDAADRRYAQSIARRLQRWLDALRLPHRTLDDEALDAAALRSAAVALLSYNPYPTPRQLSLLRAFVERGGKLVVFYGAHPGLAELMGVKMGPYLASGTEARWCAMRFGDDGPPLAPELVAQESRNVRPVYPRPGVSAVVAWWEDAAGRRLPDPAWVRSAQGFWMTHVLLGDGDEWAKKQLLLAVISPWLPAVRDAGVRALMSEAARLNTFGGLEDALASTRQAAAGGPREGQTRAAVAACRRLRETAERHAGRGDYARALRSARSLREALVRAYAAAQTPRAGERRGVWDHSGLGLYPGDWSRTCRLLVDHGFTDVFPNLAGGGVALYPSKLLPVSERLAAHGDQLAQCVVAAHKSGLRCHVWKVCWNLEGAPEWFVTSMKRARRLQVDDQGRAVPWLCPSREENLKLEKDVIREILDNYAVDGIHLDYVRYPGGHSCYCSHCRSAFERDRGRAAAAWPRDVRHGPLRGEYAAWRAQHITRLVRDLATVVKRAQPPAVLSAAVFGKYPSCRESVGQDWVLWMRRDYLDFVCPMNYTADLRDFLVLTSAQTAAAGPGRLWPGLGVTAAESRLNPPQVIRQINGLRRVDAAGFVLFELNRVLERETLPALRLGITAPPQRAQRALRR